MTTEEAIKTLERAEGYVGIHYINGVEDPYINPCLLKAIDYAIAALRAQQEQENPKPLTLKELREMDGELVLLETGEVSIREQLMTMWEILIEHDDDVFFFTRRKRGFSANNYGVTWLAYRQKPKEEPK